MKFEFVGVDPNYPDSKIYDVEAIHVTTSGNGRKYTKDELKDATLSLAFRPLDINHDDSKILPYPDNQTLMAHFDETTNGIKTRIRVVDQSIIKKIEKGRIKAVSVSQVSNEMCADSMCSTKLQYGMAFTRLALLEGTTPGDSGARIIKMESISDILKCDAGCKCSKCENYHCPECDKEFDSEEEKKKHMMEAHKKEEAEDDCVSNCLKAKADKGIEIDDQAKAICISECKKDENNSINAKESKESQMVETSKDKKESTTAEVVTTTNKDGSVSTATFDKQNIGDAVNDSKSTERQLERETPEIHAMDPSFWVEFKNHEQRLLDGLVDRIAAAYKPKTESTTQPSSMVDDSSLKSKKEEMDKVYSFFKNIKERPRDAHTELGVSWTVDKEEYLKNLGYQTPAEYIKQKQEVSNSVTLTNALGTSFGKQVLLIPGARMKIPVRQYCQVRTLVGENVANFYKIGGVDFGAITEGTAPTASTQTVTRIQATVAVRGALEYIGYSNIEETPYPLIDAVNQANMLAAIDDEGTDLLDTVYDAVTVTNWVNGASGAAITNANDDIASMTFDRDGILGGKRLLLNQGHDVSPGSAVLFIHPKNWQDLMADTNLNNFYQYARPDITALGVLEQLYGIDIVVTNQVNAKDNTTNDTYRNVMAIKGVGLGIATGRDVLFEAQRRNEIQQVLVSATQKVKGAVIEETATVRISGAQ